MNHFLASPALWSDGIFNDSVPQPCVRSAALFEDRPRQVGQSGSLLAVLIKVAGIEPRQECFAQSRPLGIDGGIPGCVPVPVLVDRRLSEYSLIREPEALRRRTRCRVSARRISIRTVGNRVRMPSSSANTSLP